MKKTISLLLSFFIFSCSQSIALNKDNNHQASNNNLNKNNNTQSSNNITKNQIKVLPINEMDTIPNFETFVINEINTLSKEKVNLDILNCKDQIININLSEISKWAKNEMVNYKIQNSYIENITIEKNYLSLSENMVKIKIADLPSHSPLVKRFLYLFNVYDKNNNIKVIYLTIQGYAEE